MAMRMGKISGAGKNAIDQMFDEGSSMHGHAMKMFAVDLVALADTYVGELVRGSSQRKLVIRQSRRGQLSTEAHGEIS